MREFSKHSRVKFLGGNRASFANSQHLSIMVPTCSQGHLSHSKRVHCPMDTRPHHTPTQVRRFYRSTLACWHHLFAILSSSHHNLPTRTAGDGTNSSLPFARQRRTACFDLLLSPQTTSWVRTEKLQCVLPSVTLTSTTPPIHWKVQLIAHPSRAATMKRTSC